MKIEKSKYVSLSYVLSLDGGEEVERSDPKEPLGFVFGFGMLVPGLESQIEGMQAGESKKVVVEPEDGYGVVVPEMIRSVPRDQFQPDMEIEAGQTYASQTAQGIIRFTVKSLDDKEVSIDLNHPLAGQRLHFDVSVSEVRDATEEELQPVLADCSSGDCGSCCGDCG
ncbi:MAG: peptidylprolyl isomerase [Deltaproteobacteria bacterium]|nr:peptidylprolyl isomerase [Deltaproteobacteria bacterium]